MKNSRDIIARRHHYVPQFYLKGFTRGGTKESPLYAWNLDTGRQFTTIPRHVAAEKDFLRVDIDGVAPDFVETAMRPFESEADAVLCAFRASAQLPIGDDFDYVLTLMALIATRNPRMRAMMTRFHEQVAEQIMSLTLATKERFERSLAAAKRDGYVTDDVTYEDAKSFHDRRAYRLSVSREHLIGLELAGHEAALEALASRHWSIAIAQPGAGEFITCDHPVILTRHRVRDGSRKQVIPAGLGTPRTDVTFPVSKTICLVGRFEEPAYVIRANHRFVAHANGRVFRGAERQVYAASPSFAMLDREGKVIRVKAAVD